MQESYPPEAGPQLISRTSFKHFWLPLELALIVAMGAFALTVNINAHPLIDWDEATYAEVAHEALHNGRFVNLTWNGAPYVKKPPLLFWMVTASFKAFGESEWAARLPSVIAGVGTLILVYLIAAPVLGGFGAFLAAMAPLEFYFFIARGGRECATDAPLLFFSALAILAFSRGPGKRSWMLLSGAACGLAVMSKGLAGVLPMIVAGGALAFLPGFAGAGLGGLLWIVAGAALTAGPWYLYEALFNYPVFLSSFIGHETLRRVTSHLEDNQLVSDFPLVTFGSEVRHLWPLLLPLGALLIGGWRQGIAATLRRVPPAIGLWILWFAVTLAAACAVQTRLPWYVLPSLIPAALLAAAIPAAALRRGARLSPAAILAMIALAMIVMGAPRRWKNINQSAQRQRNHSMPSYVLALKARAEAAQETGAELFFAGAPLPTLVYYLRMHCNFVETSELEHVELVGASSVPEALRLNDLVLLDSSGRARVIGNLSQEWHWAAEDRR
jgi:4-amino-4-deoxy-L-arabinose transferase-like glycosyltransferase